MIKNETPYDNEEYWNQVYQRELYDLKCTKDVDSLFHYGRWNPYIGVWTFLFNLLLKEGKLVDLGCGSGLFLSFLQNKVNLDLWGWDISSIGIKFARVLVKEAHFITIDLKETNYTDATIFTMIDVWEHFEHPEDILPKIIERAPELKQVLITTTLEEGYENGKLWPEHQRSWNLDEFKEALLPLGGKLIIKAIPDMYTWESKGTLVGEIRYD